MILEANGAIVSSLRPRSPEENFVIVRFGRMLSERKSYLFERFQDNEYGVAFATSPGFETYSTQWKTVLAQDIR